MILYPTNPYQTPITEELRDSLSKEVWDDFMDAINNIEFVRRLISPERKKAKDLPRDKWGRILVDICNPHILEDMDYFRQAAIHYKKYGCYTNLLPDMNPKSEYGQWIGREVTRCLDGMVRPSDGEWIPGDLYFYLNYLPIIQTKIRKGTKIGDRVVDFPEVWEGVYLRFHYQWQARNGGMYDDFVGAKHAVEIASRGRSKSYSAAAIMCKMFLLGESFESSEKVKCLITSYQKEYLIKDGTLNKFVDGIDFCSKYTQFPRSRLKNSVSDMQWISGYIDKETNIPKGSQNEVLGVAIKDDPDKIRGKRPVALDCIVPTPDGWKSWKDIHTGDQLFGKDGKVINVIDETTSEEMDLYRIELQDGRSTLVGPTHPFEVIYRSAGKFKKRIVEAKFLENNTVYKNNKYNLYKFYLDNTGVVQYKEHPIPIDAYTLGLYLGDGCYKQSHSDYLHLTMLREDIDSIEKCIPYKVEKSKYREISHRIHLGISSLKILEDLGLKDKNSSNKFIPTQYLQNSEAIRFNLLAGLLDTDGSVYKDGRIEFSSKSKVLSENVVELCRSLGINCMLKSRIINNTEYYRVNIYSNNLRLFKLERKQARLSNRKSSAYTKMTAIKSVTLEKIGFAKCVTVDSEDHLHLINDFIPTHNSNRMFYEEFGAFPKFLDVWQTALPNVQENNIAFGQAVAFGTGGSEGCLTGNNFVFTGDGNVKLVKDLQVSDTIIGYDLNNGSYIVESITYLNTPTLKECVKITTNSGRTIECSIDHPIYSSVKSDYNERLVWQWHNAADLKKGNYLAICQEVPVFSNTPIFDARLVGLLIGDGSYITSPRITTCDDEIKSYIRRNYKTTVYNKPYKTKSNKILEEIGIKGIRQFLRDLGIYGQSRNNKRLPSVIFEASKQDVCALIAGLIDTDGNISNIFSKTRKKWASTISIATSCKELAQQIQLLLQKIGVYSNIITKKPSKNINKQVIDKNPYYSIEISSRDSILNLHKNVSLLIKYKQEALNQAAIHCSLKKSGRTTPFYREKIANVEYIGKQEIYNLSTTNTHTYLGNGIITHNSDFIGALEMINYPEGYNVYAIPNVFDKGTVGVRKTIFFFPSYLNSKGFYNENGVSDVVGALIDEIKHRVILKYNSSDPIQLTRRKAEYAFTIVDAIMRRDNNIFPSDKLNDRILELDSNPSSMDDMWIGRLVQTKEGSIAFTPDSDIKPILSYPHKDNKLEGAIHINKMPVKGPDGKVPWGRYIAGIDPYDDDTSDTLSLGAIYVLDLFTDELVCEYVGRPMFAEDFYETCRRILMLYNAECNYENNKKGLFTYFSQHNSLYLLSDVLEFLKDKEMIKGNLYGNKSKGTNASQPIQGYGRRCIRDWLLKPIKVIKSVDVDGHTEEVEVTINNINRCYYRALMQELATWDPDNNFDRYDALLMLMLLREQKLMLCGARSPSEVINENIAADYLGNDEFFTRNYDYRFAKNKPKEI